MGTYRLCVESGSVGCSTTTTIRPHELVLVRQYPCRTCSLLTIRQHRPPQGSDGVLDINRKAFTLGTLWVIEELFTYVGQWRYFVGDA
jgi:hypothetical protein